MKISGSSLLHATPDRVWAAINDPVVLAAVIPGCNALDPLGPGHFGLTVTLGVASIKGSYVGEVQLSDLKEPQSLTMRARGSGTPGTIDTTVLVRLGNQGDGTTLLEYDADAMVGGMVGGVGQRVLAGVARKTAGLFFSAIDDVLTGVRSVDRAVTVPAGPGTAGPAGTAAGPQHPVPNPAAGPGPTPGTRALGIGDLPTGTLLGAAGFGALSMLVGVLVGARIARRR